LPGMEELVHDLLARPTVQRAPQGAGPKWCLTSMASRRSVSVTQKVLVPLLTM